MMTDSARLLSDLKQAVLEERKATTRVLHLLREVEARRLYAERGFDSLFSFAVQYLGYSEAAAHRRISAMRALRDLPELEHKITAGALSLTNIAQAQVHFRNEAKAHKPVSREEKLELFSKLENKSARDCEKLLLSLSPNSVPQEKRRELTSTQTELKLVLSEELVMQLDRLKKLWSHKNPAMSDGELIQEMADFCLSKIDPLRKASAPKTPAPEVTSKISRHVPTGIRTLVWQRDQGCCQFKDPLTGQVCHSTRLIQIDHKHPWSWGGPNTPENLQLLCSTHNKLRASKVFAKSKQHWLHGISKPTRK